MVSRTIDQVGDHINEDLLIFRQAVITDSISAYLNLMLFEESRSKELAARNRVTSYCDGYYT